MSNRVEIRGDVERGLVIAGDKNRIYVTYERVERIDQTDSSEPQRSNNIRFSPNPYKGLLFFEEADANRFFGREELTKLLYDRLIDILRAEEGQPRVLPVLGPSGCGKSSLVRAGLIPRLVRERFVPLLDAQVLVLVPGPRPLEALARGLARLATGDASPVAKTDEFLEIIAKTGSTDGLRKIIDALPMLESARLVLVIDQFEELYVPPAAPMQREAFETERDLFISTLIDAARDRQGRAVAVIAMRSDFLGATQRHTELNAQIARSGFLVPGMSKTELEDAIRKPAEQSSPPYRYPLAFVELLTNETLGRPGALPLLQFSLQRVWDALPTDPAETLEKLGGVGGVIAIEAERAFARLSEGDQAIARRAFLAMVNLSEGIADTRRRAMLDEITTSPTSAEREQWVLRQFSRPDARLVSLSQEPGRVMTFEVAHETLIRRWGRLQTWLDQSRDDQRFLRRAREAAALWADGKGSLWRSFELQQLTEFAQRAPGDMTAGLNRFLEASVAALTAEESRDRKRRRSIWSSVGAAVVFFVFACMGSVYSVYQVRNTLPLLQGVEALISPIQSSLKIASALENIYGLAEAYQLSFNQPEQRQAIFAEIDDAKRRLAADQKRVLDYSGPEFAASICVISRKCRRFA